jgi:hypothetical protein
LGGEMKSTLEKLKEDEFCFSALLLEEFIKKFAKKTLIFVGRYGRNGPQTKNRKKVVGA